MNHATAEGTARAFARRTSANALKPKPFGSTGLLTSPIGFGGYRTTDVEPEHRAALRRALLSGVNLIDTSANYGDGGSERLIGDALRDLIAEGLIARDEIIVVTKAGYVQGANLLEARRRLASNSPYPEMVEYRPDCWHCIAPDFLSDQLSRSLERLRLETVDAFLLHNPEYFLRAGGTREEFDRRLLKAFARLEEEADNGRIARYGVSSNGFPESINRPDWVCLERVHELAQRAAQERGHKQSRFAVAQFPLNAFEPGAALAPNSANGDSTLASARKLKIAAIANRPLNAYYRGRIARLSSFQTHDEVEIKGEMHKLLGRAIELEKRRPAERPNDRAAQGLGWGHALREKLGELDDVLSWRDALAQQIYPSLSKSLERARERDPEWAEQYRPVILELLSLVGRDLESVAHKRAIVIASQFAAVAPSLADSKTLSQMAIRFAVSFPAVSSALVGMRTEAYVDDALAAQTPIPESEALALAQSLQRRG